MTRSFCAFSNALIASSVRIVSDNSEEYPEINLTAEEKETQQFQVIGWVWQIARIERW